VCGTSILNRQLIREIQENWNQKVTRQLKRQTDPVQTPHESMGEPMTAAAEGVGCAGGLKDDRIPVPAALAAAGVEHGRVSG
jgi:hypothetical protein